MDVATVQLLARYNRETNLKMGGLIATLSPEQWEMDLGGYFPSVKAMTNHIYIGDYIWIKRFATFKDFRFAGRDLLKVDRGLRDEAFSTVAAYGEHRAALDAAMEDFARELTDRDLQADLEYRDTRGNSHRKPYGGLILHMFNHQSHHRGMISLYLEKLGMANDFSNLVSIL